MVIRGKTIGGTRRTSLSTIPIFKPTSPFIFLILFQICSSGTIAAELSHWIHSQKPKLLPTRRPLRYTPTRFAHPFPRLTHQLSPFHGLWPPSSLACARSIPLWPSKGESGEHPSKCLALTGAERHLDSGHGPMTYIQRMRIDMATLQLGKKMLRQPVGNDAVLQRP
jgi:hypothetical protein